MVVERLKLYHKARDLKSLAKFNLMDRVHFTHEGKQITGRVMKLNRRSVTVLTADGRPRKTTSNTPMRPLVWKPKNDDDQEVRALIIDCCAGVRGRL